MEKRNKDLINPEFKTSTFYGLKSLTKEELLYRLKNDNSIYRSFKKYGIIHSKEYPFITKTTFSIHEKNCVEGAKNTEEILQAKERLFVVEEYFNNCQQNQNRPISIDFAERDDNECAIYDLDRFNFDTLQIKLKQIFG